MQAQAASPTNRFPIDTRLRPLTALRAARTLIATGDTRQVFILLRAMRGRSGLRNFRRFAQSDVGRDVLRESRDLLPLLQDREGLRRLPAGSLGRAYWEYCRKNGFALPGEKGGAPGQILFHDCAHILSGYGTAPEEEVQVACFSAGFQRRDPFTFILFVLLQFHLGIRMTPITEARTGFFDPEKAMIAVRRGAAMNVDLNGGWEYWPVMGEQVEELRRRYNILPIEAFRPKVQDAIGELA